MSTLDHQGPMDENGDPVFEDEDTTYWLVYLYRFENERMQWVPLGIVQDRQTWMDWWEEVIEGEKELPSFYNEPDWWISDRLVDFGLPDLE